MVFSATFSMIELHYGHSHPNLLRCRRQLTAQHLIRFQAQLRLNPNSSETNFSIILTRISAPTTCMLSSKSTMIRVSKQSVSSTPFDLCFLCNKFRLKKN